MKSKKKASKKKAKGKSKKKSAKKANVVVLNTTGLFTGDSSEWEQTVIKIEEEKAPLLTDKHVEVSPEIADWLVNNPNMWDPEFTLEACGCELPKKGCLDEIPHPTEVVLINSFWQKVKQFFGFKG